MAIYDAPESLHVGNGVETVFGFNWPYLLPRDLIVTVNGQPVPTVLASPNQVAIAPAPAALAIVRIYRNTPAQNPTYLFSTGIPMLPKYIDGNNKQLLYALQEGLLQFAATQATAEEALEAARNAEVSAAAAAASAAQQARDMRRTVRVPTTDPEIPVLPPVAARQGKLMGFDGAGNPVGVIPASGSGAELALDLADPTTPYKGAGMVANAEVQLQTLADLRAYAGRRTGDAAAIHAFHGGWATSTLYPHPCGGGSFVWNADSTATPISGMVVQVTGLAVGRWFRKFSGPVHITWLGAVPDGVTKASAAMQEAVDNYKSVYIPPGTFLINNYTTHPLIYKGDTEVMTCGVKLTEDQKCRELFGAGDASALVSELGVRYNALISVYNINNCNIHSFNMDGRYDRSGSTFVSALTGIRMQSVKQGTTHSMQITNFTYHCLAMYGGSDAVLEPACIGNSVYNMRLHGGGQSSLLLYSAAWTGLVLPNEWNSFVDIQATGSHVYFGIEVRKSNHNTFANIHCMYNQKGGINLEEGASFNKFVNVESRYNGYGLHMVSNNAGDIVGNEFTQFDFSDNNSHGVLAFMGARSNRFTTGHMDRSVVGNGWRSQDGTSYGNYFRDVTASSNFGDGLLFQNAENVDGAICLNNGNRGITVFNIEAIAKLRNVTARGNLLDIASASFGDVVVDAVDCNFGANHGMLMSNGSDAGRIIRTYQSGRYSSGGATGVTEVAAAGSLSPLVWRTSTQYGTFSAISLGHMAGSGDVRIRFRVQTDGAAIRILRNTSDAGISVSVPAATGWQWVTMTIPAAAVTPTYIARMRFEGSSGFMLFDAYQIATF